MKGRYPHFSESRGKQDLEGLSHGPGAVRAETWLCVSLASELTLFFRLLICLLQRKGGKEPLWRYSKCIIYELCADTHVHTRRCMLAYVSPSSKWTLSRSMVAYKPHCFVHQVLLAPEPHTDFFFPFLAAFVAHRVPRPGIRSEPQLQSMLQQYRILYSGGPGIERVSWCSRDTTDPVATQWEHHTWCLDHGQRCHTRGG